jgi:hypothetical protein
LQLVEVNLKHEEQGMSIFGSIVSAIFGGGKPAAAPTGGVVATAAKTAAPSVAASAAASSAAASAGSPPATAKPITRQEVEATIKALAANSKEDLNWRQSIVDLMKLLKLDSSLTARKQLAQELGYKGELNGSAEMNIWLHEQVMIKLAEGGGVVPESLKH